MASEHRETNQTFYDRISRAYDFIADAGEHKAREAGERMLELTTGERALEIGFGTGSSIVNLATSVSPTGNVCGIDVSPGMLTVAKEKVADKGLSDCVELKVGDARELPYEDATFDAVFTSFTLELFPSDDIPMVLAEVRRVLRDGGRLGVVSMATVNQGEQASLLEKTYIWMHRHFPHIVDCRPIDVGQCLGDAGFDARDEIDMEIWTMPVKAIVGVKGSV
jgi:demethylmenaquinone methyltransferase/2-methoxy-6-polyprenyl-1,4-benzoquinol methylase